MGVLEKYTSHLSFGDVRNGYVLGTIIVYNKKYCVSYKKNLVDYIIKSFFMSLWIWEPGTVS